MYYLVKFLILNIVLDFNLYVLFIKNYIKSVIKIINMTK